MNEDVFYHREEEIKELYLRLLISDVGSGNRSEPGDLMSIAREAIEIWEESHEEVTDELLTTLVAPKNDQIIGILRGTEIEIEIDNVLYSDIQTGTAKAYEKAGKTGRYIDPNWRNGDIRNWILVSTGKRMSVEYNKRIPLPLGKRKRPTYYHSVAGHPDETEVIFRLSRKKTKTGF